MEEEQLIRMQCLKMALERLGRRALLADIFAEADRLASYIRAGRSDE